MSTTPAPRKIRPKAREPRISVRPTPVVSEALKVYCKRNKNIPVAEAVRRGLLTVLSSEDMAAAKLRLGITPEEPEAATRTYKLRDRSKRKL